jgi:Antitoxin Xre/MbcA/ParS C-terminal toxin-binding domain/Antitoxin Xre-like helix-turn-helix domain
MNALPHAPVVAGYRFDKAADLGDAAERERLSSAAIRGFLNIAKRWELSEMESRALLGGIASSTLHAWRSRPRRTKLSQDTLTRISLMLGIYKALHIYFGAPWSDRWVNLQNRGPLFAGQTPLEFMIQHGQPGMVAVRRMLDSWRGGQ